MAPDIEQAPSHTCDKEPPRQQEKSIDPPKADPASKYIRNIEAEKVIVLSFRELQLRRIGELQDDLLRLAAITASGVSLSADHKAEVDKALQAYGKC